MDKEDFSLFYSRQVPFYFSNDCFLTITEVFHGLHEGGVQGRTGCGSGCQGGDHAKVGLHDLRGLLQSN